MTAKEIIDKCTGLKMAAICQDQGSFEECNYEWEIGASLKRILEHDMFNFCHSDEVNYIMGIPVRINLVDPNCIKLWRRIKE